MPKVVEIPQDFVHVEWPSSEAFLVEALKYSQGELEIHQLRADAAQGRIKMFKVFGDARETLGVVLVEFVNARHARMAFVLAIGGRGIVKPEMFEAFKAALRKHGATCLQGAGRDSIVRLYAPLGLRKKYTVFGADL